jgi:hypothetical protein
MGGINDLIIAIKSFPEVPRNTVDQAKAESALKRKFQSSFQKYQYFSIPYAP